MQFRIAGRASTAGLAATGLALAKLFQAEIIKGLNNFSGGLLINLFPFGKRFLEVRALAPPVA